MSKTKNAKLTPKAIAFIIECKNDLDKIWTLEDIQSAILDKFNIGVSTVAIHRSYHRNKDSLSSRSKPISLKVDLKSRRNDDEKPLSKPSGFDESAGENFTKEDLKNLL